jgi:general secretion pathway protein K
MSYASACKMSVRWCARADRPCRDRERGAALLVVLWMLALLTVLILSLTSATRTELNVAHNQEETAQARAIADAGVTLAILATLDPSPTTQWPGTGDIHNLRFGSGTIRVAVQDEYGKIDLNVAPPELLAGLFRTLALSETESDRLVAAIMSLRAEALAQSATGADTSAAASVLVPQKPFLAIEELRLLPGMTPTLYERLEPFLTVYSAQYGVNPLTAPPQVLQSLPGATPDLIATFLAARSAGGSAAGPLPLLVGVSDIVFGGLHLFTVTSEGRAQSGARFVREAVVDASNPDSVRFLSWRQAQELVAATPSAGVARPTGLD